MYPTRYLNLVKQAGTPIKPALVLAVERVMTDVEGRFILKLMSRLMLRLMVTLILTPIPLLGQGSLGVVAGFETTLETGIEVKMIQVKDPNEDRNKDSNQASMIPSSPL